MFAVKFFNATGNVWQVMGTAQTRESADAIKAERQAIDRSEGATHRLYAVVELLRERNSRKFFKAFQTLNTPIQDDKTACTVYRLRNVLERRYYTIV